MSEEYKSQNLIINDDVQVELHHNPMVNHQPYLLRVFGYDGSMEYRLNQQDMLNLADQLADFVFDNSNEVEYTDNYTGLVRLWHHRRNECLDKIEELEKRLQSYEQDNNHR
jgi:hypothetical protein